MKAELRLSAHSLRHNAECIEVWYDGRFVAAVYGADGPGVRVVSKHELSAVERGIVAAEEIAGCGFRVIEVIAGRP